MTTQTVMVLGGLAFVGVISVWRGGRKSATKAHKGVREVTRMTGNAVRTLVTAALIVGLQLFVIFVVDNTTATAVVLIIPAVFAGAAVARLLAVTEIVATTRGHR